MVVLPFLFSKNTLKDKIHQINLAVSVPPTACLSIPTSRACAYSAGLPAKKAKPIELITLDDIEARIYRVQQGYRVEVYSTLSDYWHPGIFGDFQQLEEWLKAELEKLNDGFPLSGDWMMFEGDFDGNGTHRDWFICQAQNWQGYDPLTNHCHTAPSLKQLQEKIDRIEDERLDVL